MTGRKDGAMRRGAERLARKSAACALACALAAGFVPAAALATEDAGAVDVGQEVGIETLADRTDGTGLEDGAYTVSVEMRQTNLTDVSMTNEAVESTATLEVEDGVYSIVLDLVVIEASSGSSTLTGYLANLDYYLTGFTVDSRFGTISGETSSAEVLAYQKTADGEDVYDEYNTSGSSSYVYDGLYPAQVSIVLPQEAIDAVQIGDEADPGAGYAPLSVFVPVMEAISAGLGTQTCYLRIDWTTLADADGNAVDAGDDAVDADGDGSEGAIDTSALAAAIEAAAALEQGDKSDDAWAALQDAIEAARTALENPTDQAAVDAATAVLEAAVTAFDESDGEEALDFENLPDGTYSVSVDMYQTNGTSLSMTNDAINHDVMLTVEDGTYYLTFDFQGITLNSSFGYLGSLSYYDNGYTISGGSVTGTLVPGDVLSVQENEDGTPITDEYSEYNNDTYYPNQVRIEYVSDAIADPDGFVPLQVFVPIMEAISAGLGTQDVLAKVDKSSVVQASETDFTDNQNNASSGTTTTTRSSLTQTGDSAAVATAAAAALAVAGAVVAGIARRRCGSNNEE